MKNYDYGFLSEESEDDLSRLGKEKVWIIDPLDGTNDFLERTGEFSVMVGLVDKNQPILGVVYLPVGDKLLAKGLENKEIGEKLNIPRKTVSKWRKRFFFERERGLVDRPREGRPFIFSP